MNQLYFLAFRLLPRTTDVFSCIHITINRSVSIAVRKEREIMTTANSTVARSAALAIAALASSFPSIANGAITLTPAGISQGFTLSTYATGFPVDTSTSALFDPSGQGIGPAGITFTGSNVLIGNATGTLYIMPDVDGQAVTGSTTSVSYSHPRDAFGLVSAGGTLYMTQQKVDISHIHISLPPTADPGSIVQINPNGTLNQLITNTSTTTVADPYNIPGFSTIPISDAPTGIVVNPANGHLIVGTYLGQQLLDVNPATKSFTVMRNLASAPDGLAITANAATLYIAQQTSTGDHVYAYNMANIANAPADLGAVSGADGLVLGTGSLANLLFVNTNGGTIVEINLSTLQQTVIASGGSRGDFAAPDPSNASMLLTQQTSVVRLLAPPGGGFVGGAPVPEPATLGLFTLTLTIMLRRNPRR